MATSAEMSVDEGKRKARAAVEAMFERYKLLASKRPNDHVVRISVFLYPEMNAE